MVLDFSLENCEFQRYEEVYPVSSKSVEDSNEDTSKTGSTMTEGWHYMYEIY